MSADRLSTGISTLQTVLTVLRRVGPSVIRPRERELMETRLDDLVALLVEIRDRRDARGRDGGAQG